MCVCVCVCVYLPISSTPGKIWHKVIFSNGVMRVWIQIFSSEMGCFTKAEELCLLYYVPIAQGKTDLL